MQFFVALISVLGTFVFQHGVTLFRIILLIVSLTALVAITTSVSSFLISAYVIIKQAFFASSELISSSTAKSSIFCLMHTLGITQVINSAFGILWTAFMFWGNAIVVIFIYRATQKSRDIILKVK